MKQYKNIDEFISTYPKDVQVKLQKLRQVIKGVAPKAQEKIAYGIPTFTLNGNLVHFSAYKKHVGFYPGSSGVKSFEKELASYETSRGTIRFPIDKPLPYDLIRKIVEYRLKENLQKQ